MQKIIYKARHIIEACTEEMTLKCSRLFSLGNMRLAVFFLLSFLGHLIFFVFSKIPTLSVDYLYNHKIILFEQIKPSLYASIHMSIQHTGLSGAPSAARGKVPASRGGDPEPWGKSPASQWIQTIAMEAGEADPSVECLKLLTVWVKTNSEAVSVPGGR